LLNEALPRKLLAQHPRIVAAFHSQSLTHHDIGTLASKFAALHPDRQRPILLVGVRTAGSHFAPLANAYLRLLGYKRLDSATVRSTKGITSMEAGQMARSAQKGALAVILDEPINTGSAIAQTVQLLLQAGFPLNHIVALVPNHPYRRGWRWPDRPELASASQITTVLLEKEEWHKWRLLDPENIKCRLDEYFQAQGYANVALSTSPRLEQLTAELEALSPHKGHIQFKRLYEVLLQKPSGETETRYVLAKSTGVGWLSYHSFFVAEQLANFLPPTLGLREGFLFTEWLPQPAHGAVPSTRLRDEDIDWLASYVAARVKALPLKEDLLYDLVQTYELVGLGSLAEPFSHLYRNPVIAALRRGRLRHRFAKTKNPRPTFTDSKMRPVEWVRGPAGLFKTDFEHHGFGKPELNATDPAYDLADAILSWELPPEDEARLLAKYIEQSGDNGVRQRLFLYKILAGVVVSDLVLQILLTPHLLSSHEAANLDYSRARNFLTIQATRFCGNLCRRPTAIHWGSPLAILDIDGVLDAWSFGFVSTTAAGIEAVSLLHAHGYAIAVDTARSLKDVREYCKAYGFAGGVAEYGSVLWDAVQQKEIVLLDPDTLRELQRVKTALRQIPGIFVNDRYEYSVRAYQFEKGQTVAAPTTLIEQVLQSLRVRNLYLHQVSSESAILAKNADKGTGLLSLLSWVGMTEAETVAIGDSPADLPMFRAVKHSFGPAQIRCREEAERIGCKVVTRSYQAGFLQIVRSLVHPDGRQCQLCKEVKPSWSTGKDLFLDFLVLADKRKRWELLKALLDPMTLRAFEK
jgi:hydroxymethylpyrimidine pyrophosphatase-like HAD family hydrolase